MAPLLIKGLTLSTWPLAKPLIILVLIPLLIGIAIRPTIQRWPPKYFLRSRKPAVSSCCCAWVPAVDLRQGDARHDRQLCAGRMGPVHGPDGSAAVRDWLSPGSEPEKRHGSGHEFAQYLGRFCGVFRHYGSARGHVPDGFLVVPLHVIIGLLAVPPIFARLADPGKSAT